MASVKADGLQLVFPRVGDRRVLRIGQHDRRAVGAEQREQAAGPARIAGACGNSRCASSDLMVLT